MHTRNFNFSKIFTKSLWEKSFEGDCQRMNMDMNMNRQHEDKGHKDKDKKRCGIIGEFNGKVLSEMQKFSQYLMKLSGEYGIEPGCISPWKHVFLDTIWVIFSSMFPAKMPEKECFLGEIFLFHFPIDIDIAHSDPDQPGPGESVIRSPYPYPYLHAGSDTNPSPSPCPLPELIRANTVSPLYRRSTSPFRQHKNRYVPLLRLSGLWLESFGFGIGRKYEIYAMENQLILRTGSCGSSCSCSCELDEPMEVEE